MYQLEVDEKEVAKYLGGGNCLDEDTRIEIREISQLLRKEVNPKIEYRAFDIKREDGCIKVEGTNLVLEGIGIQELLKECNRCILLAVTLGQKVDVILRRLQIMNLSQAVIMDFCASSMVEHLVNQVNEELKEKYLPKGLHLTDRFSPGYGDLSLGVQGRLCEVLDTSRQMGLHVSQSEILIPRKSITAVIGIAEEKQKMKIRGCKYCDLFEDCEYRKGGGSCEESMV